MEVRVVNTSGPVDNQVFPQGDFLPPFLNMTSGASFIELNRQTVIDFGVSGTLGKDFLCDDFVLYVLEFIFHPLVTGSCF